MVWGVKEILIREQIWVWLEDWSIGETERLGVVGVGGWVGLGL